MKLPRDLLSGKYTRPRVFLCETDKTRICQLDVFNFNGTFKFNSLSEISCEIGRIYNDFLTGQNKVNPFYNKVEALRLLEIEGFGYFEIQGPKLSSDGIKEIKAITAYSLEYTLSQKYLTNFYINTGEIGSVEVTEANDGPIIPVTLYNQGNHKLSLLHLILEKIYGWSIGHVDNQLKTLSRTFNIDRISIYDFIMNEICDKFNCYVEFDTINNIINFYAESSTAKFIGDGKTNQFVISPPFYEIGTVSIDGYKTTQWEYNQLTGILSLTEIPESGCHIEVVDKSLKPWETDVLVAFDNLSNEMNITYDADEIKTVLTVTYGDDNDIRETNLGLPYLTDISYFYTVDWMGQELYDAYTLYLQKTNEKQLEYTNNSKQLQDIAGYIEFEENRLSLGYSESQVSPSTTGTYYIRGGSEPQYYYTEVSLPADYNANTTYYKINTANLAEKKVENLYNVFKEYFMSETHPELEDGTGVDWVKDAEKLQEDFHFMEQDYNNLINALKSVTTNRIKSLMVQDAILYFLDKMWNEIGRAPLKSLYYESYKKIQIVNVDAGWSQTTNYNYPIYYPVTLMLESITNAINSRKRKIRNYQKTYNEIQKNNIDISNDLLLSNNFTPKQLVRLSSFLREDELKLDDIVETEADSILDTFKNKQHAMESGRIELSKLSQPRLQFSMSMANIYAIPEFEPIINQFQLGKLIKVRLRPDYTKQSRLLKVKINFDDFSDFSCDFGDLTNLRTQSDIHADLLASAISAGKQVATNSSYWTKGADKVTSLDLSLQQGLLDTVEALKAADGTQNASMDKYGIHLESVDPITGEVNDKKVWMVNDKIVFTDDNFKTSKSILGEYTINGETRWGLISEYVNAGLIEGCSMKGGTIQIGEQPDGSYAFEVRKDGSVVMSGGGIVDGFVTEEMLDKVNNDLTGKIDGIDGALTDKITNTNNNLIKEITDVNDSLIKEINGVDSNLTDKISGVDSNLTDKINDVNDSLSKQLNSLTKQHMYRIEVVVTGSTIISTTEDEATLTCIVYSWDTDVTENFDNSLFKWKRISDNPDMDIIWNAMPEHQNRKDIPVNANDVIGNSRFYCEVDLP